MCLKLCLDTGHFPAPRTAGLCVWIPLQPPSSGFMRFSIPQKSSCTWRAVPQLPWADLNQHNAQTTGLALLSVFENRSFGKERITCSMVSQQPKLVCAGTGTASGCAFPPRSPLDQSSQVNDFFLFVMLIFLPPSRPALGHAGGSPKTAFSCAKNRMKCAQEFNIY